MTRYCATKSKKQKKKPAIPFMIQFSFHNHTVEERRAQRERRSRLIPAFSSPIMLYFKTKNKKRTLTAALSSSINERLQVEPFPNQKPCDRIYFKHESCRGGIRTAAAATRARVYPGCSAKVRQGKRKKKIAEAFHYSWGYRRRALLIH